MSISGKTVSKTCQRGKFGDLVSGKTNFKSVRDLLNQKSWLEIAAGSVPNICYTCTTSAGEKYTYFVLGEIPPGKSERKYGVCKLDRDADAIVYLTGPHEYSYNGAYDWMRRHLADFDSLSGLSPERLKLENQRLSKALKLQQEEVREVRELEAFYREALDRDYEESVSLLEHIEDLQQQLRALESSYQLALQQVENLEEQNEVLSKERARLVSNIRLLTTRVRQVAREQQDNLKLQLQVTITELEEELVRLGERLVVCQASEGQATLAALEAANEALLWKERYERDHNPERI